MQVFNIMEELVLETVHEVFKEKKAAGFDLAECEQCKLDVACYVLNRIEPEYLISGRGVVHVQNELRQDYQRSADIVALVNEGIKIITKKQRPYYIKDLNEKKEVEGPETRKGSFFNFPAIIGTVLNGKTFQPAENLNIFLYEKDTLVPMIDRSWPNPYFVVRSTRGSFSFWPKPVKAIRKGERRDFCLEIIADSEGFQTTRHFIELQLTAVEEYCTTFSMERSHKVENLYLFGETSEEEQRSQGVEEL